MTHPLSLLHPRSLKHLNRHLQELIRRRLWAKILFAMALGVGTGVVLGPTTGYVDRNVAEVLGNWLAMPGNLFLGVIQMIVIPLIFASIIRGLASSDDMDQLRKMGLSVVVFFIVTTILAIIIGLGSALLIRPGDFIDSTLIQTLLVEAEPVAAVEGPVDTPSLGEVPGMVVNLLPVNPLGAMIEKEMLQVVLFAIIFGIALVSLPPKQSKPLLDLLDSIQDVCMTVVRWAMLLAPLAVFGLLAQITMRVGIEVLLGMAVYVGTVLGGLLILLLCYLVILMFVGVKPWYFLGSVREVMLLAFSTSSSAAVMPLSIQTAEEKLGVRSSISQFVIPLGATINMNGTALYQGAATVFLAQVFDVELTLPTLLLVVLTTVGASIGSPATPGVGIVILAMVLTSAGIPTSGIALIIGVDRILDMSRTAINVTGDLTATRVMERWTS